ncbi:uncharacterized protein [Battus philenor]|uniref:uncharacterized protein isoform X1 n=1 Tax=Battus philenor TaxID=42288 RepID=UPI0035CF9FAF
MLKLCPVFIVIGFILITTEGAPFGQDDIASAAASGDWNLFQKLFRNKFQSSRRRMDQNIQSMRRRMDENMQSMRSRLSQGVNFQPDFEGIRSLQPQGPDSHVYGEAQYSYHSSSNVNGQKSEQRGGRRIINKNGVVEEYDLP